MWQAERNVGPASAAAPPAHAPLRPPRTCGDVAVLAPPVLSAVGLQEGIGVCIPPLPLLCHRCTAVGGCRLQAEEALRQRLLGGLGVACALESHRREAPDPPEGRARPRPSRFCGA